MSHLHSRWTKHISEDFVRSLLSLRTIQRGKRHCHVSWLDRCRGLGLALGHISSTASCTPGIIGCAQAPWPRDISHASQSVIKHPIVYVSASPLRASPLWRITEAARTCCSGVSEWVSDHGLLAAVDTLLEEAVAQSVRSSLLRAGDRVVVLQRVGTALAIKIVAVDEWGTGLAIPRSPSDADLIAVSSASADCSSVHLECRPGLSTSLHRAHTPFCHLRHKLVLYITMINTCPLLPPPPQSPAFQACFGCHSCVNFTVLKCQHCCAGGGCQR